MGRRGGWLGVIIVCLAFSGCLIVEQAPRQVDTDYTASQADIAFAHLAARQEDADDYRLHAVVGYEVLDTRARLRAGGSQADHMALAGGDDPMRLDGRANAWVFIYRASGGSDTSYVVVKNDRGVGWGHLGGLAFLPVLEHHDAGQPLVDPVVGAVDAAATARATGLFDRVRDDAQWDLTTTLHRRAGATGPVWLFEASNPSTADVMAVAVDAVSGEIREAATEPITTTETAPVALVPPASERVIVLEVPDHGYDRLEVRVDGRSNEWTLHDPEGEARGFWSLRDPLPGAWRLVFTGALPLSVETVATACLDEEPPFRVGTLPSPCER